MAQWYPRMAVYDDVHGWNTDQYLGQGEFYLEYGDIDYEVTLPAGYIVAGSGTLQNPEQVLTPTERTRLAAAVESDTTIAIVTPDELSLRCRPAAARRHAHLAVPRGARAGRGVGRFAGLSVGRVRLGRRPRPGLLPAVRPEHLAGRRQDEPRLDRGVQHALVPLSVPADLGGRRAGLRHGVSHGRDGGAGRRRPRPLQRDHARDRAHVVPDDGRLGRAALCLDGRRVQHLHQHLLGGALLAAGRHRDPAAGDPVRHLARPDAHRPADHDAGQPVQDATTISAAWRT